MRPHKQQSAAAAGLLFLAIVSFVNAEAVPEPATSDLPNLSTITGKTTQTSSTAASTKPTSASTTASSFVTTNPTTAATSGTATNSIFVLTGAPTVAGAGIPTMVVPYTADAPFMQKSSLPEGTVFIVVGAVLGFLGACVLAWRAMVAYSINNSVKKAALASVMGDSKGPTGWISNPLSKPSRGLYSHAPDGSSLSLDPLTANGKPMGTSRASRVPPTDPSALFFSPTAAPSAGTPMAGLSTANRSSSLLPAGYYASPASQIAGGANNVTLGSSLNPNARRSQLDPDHSPDGRRASYRTSYAPGLHVPGSREHSRGRPTSSLLPPTLHNQPSTSSLGVNTGHGEELGGSRTPSAYLDDMFENHGNGSRERF
ncbi:hypothetical protein MBLNU457_g3000t1 [Dothideomycetes sp. NU457]